MECTKCKARFEPSDAAPAPYSQAFVALIKDWRLWVLSLVLTVAAGMTAGGLNLPPSWFMGAVGAAMGAFIALRLRTILKCPKCGAVFPSASFWGRMKAG